VNEDNKAVEQKTILIVEDEPAYQHALTEKLGQEGFVISQVKDGEKGFEVAMRNHPDLILLDIIMPKMDGITMMKKLRGADDWGKNVPIILLTNLSPDFDKINQAVTENLPAYYLVKSDNTITDLVEKIKERLSRPA
jgi:DNA-binding response OmpR family regulator